MRQLLLDYIPKWSPVCTLFSKIITKEIHQQCEKSAVARIDSMKCFIKLGIEASMAMKGLQNSRG